MIAAVALLGVLVLPACATTTPGSGTPLGAGSSPTTDTTEPTETEDTETSEPTETETSEPTETEDTGTAEPPSGVAIFAMGETGVVNDEDGNPLAEITVSDPIAEDAAPDEFSDPPENGAFLRVTTTITNIGPELFSAAPFDFLVRYEDGTRIEYGDGSSGIYGYDGILDFVDLNPDETITGIVVFDVDPAATGGEIVYVDISSRVLGAWTLP